jgi:ATP-dependent Clp protease ATP-binding subunit ClpB
VPFDFNVSPAALRRLLKEGYDKRYNARNLKRVVDQHVAVPLGRLVATGQVAPNDNIVVDYDKDWKYYAQAATPRSIEEGDVLAG